jgi:hypothetical protein
MLATAMVSMLLVVATSGTTTSAAPVNATITTSCGARDGDAATIDALNQAAALLGSNRLALKLNITSGDIPESAGLNQEINARFNVTATLDQALVDGAAALIPSIPVSNIGGQLLVNGPSSVKEFPVTAPNIVVSPVKGQPASVPLGSVGGLITTTGGGIITYRVGSVQFDSTLSVPSANLNFNLKLRCTVQGSNLVARTTVRDPDAPTFNPEVLALSASPGQTVTADLLGDIITEGKTPLQPESLEIVERPSAGAASISGGVFSFTAPTEPGTYSTTVQVCGAPKPDSGIPGVTEEQAITLGANWAGGGSGGLAPRPVAFTLKVGDTAETPLIWTINGRQQPPLLTPPTPENWAPANRAGEVGSYALFTTYARPTVAQVRSALESVPAIGAGNVEVTEVLDESGKLTGFKVRYINERAEQQMPNISLGQWYAVPPQEALDRLLDAATGLIGGGEGGEEGGGEQPPTGPFADLDPTSPADRAKADAIIAAEFAAGRLPSAELWDAYLDFRLIQPILAAVPEILAFITGLFPTKLEAETTTEGEDPTPPQPLCAQGVIDVTVTEVAAATATNAQVAGTNQAAGIGFVG